MPLELPISWKKDVSDRSLPLAFHPLLDVPLNFDLLRKIMLSDHHILHDHVCKLDSELRETLLVKWYSLPLLIEVAKSTDLHCVAVLKAEVSRKGQTSAPLFLSFGSELARIVSELFRCL